MATGEQDSAHEGIEDERLLVLARVLAMADMTCAVLVRARQCSMYSSSCESGCVHGWLKPSTGLRWSARLGTVPKKREAGRNPTASGAGRRHSMVYARDKYRSWRRRRTMKDPLDLEMGHGPPLPSPPSSALFGSGSDASTRITSGPRHSKSSGLPPFRAAVRGAWWQGQERWPTAYLQAGKGPKGGNTVVSSHTG